MQRLIHYFLPFFAFGLELDEAIAAYQGRQRRFGKTAEQVQTQPSSSQTVAG